MTTSITRRRLLTISAAGAGMALVHPRRAMALAGEDNLLRWHGVALGADSEILLNLPASLPGPPLIERVVGEIRRLEKIFSLYRGDSAICALNREGELTNPPPELVELLDHAREMSAATGGHFDITVQPLWELYSQYGDRPISRHLQRQVLELVDYRAVEVSLEKISFSRPGVAITLNGIAQGYITDAVTGLLRNEGLENALVGLGEVYGLGMHPDGRPWRMGIKDPSGRGQNGGPIDLVNRALATSGGYGTPLPGMRNHIFNPSSGQSPKDYESLSVIAANATTADALSTGFISMSQTQINKALQSFPGVLVRSIKKG